MNVYYRIRRILTGALEEQYRHQAKLAVKDECSFDFLEMSEDYKERDLELSLVRDMRRFLIELGNDYAFIGNQYRIKVGTEEFLLTCCCIIEDCKV